jgi:hypothetical protein
MVYQILYCAILGRPIGYETETHVTLFFWVNGIKSQRRFRKAEGA